jgi:hypothetical protein
MIANLVIALATTTRNTTAAMANGIASSVDGSSSMPTATKKRTAKASRSGRASAAAWWLTSDSPTTAPARNAPRANETPKTVDDRYANPIAMARTANVNSSFDPSFETRVRRRGTRRVPAMTMRNTNSAALPSPSATFPSVPSVSVDPFAVPPMSGATVGKTTRMTIETRSSTINQPIAIRPWDVSTSPRSVSARSRTTVLATDSDSPSTSAPPIPQPRARPSISPRIVAMTIWIRAPGIAMPRTAARSRSEKWMPTPNISRMIPMSASSSARSTSALKPGVNGPSRTPATM